MKSAILATLAAGVVAATVAAPAQAGHRHHGHGHGFKVKVHHVHHVHHRHFKVHTFRAYNHVHYAPVCVKFDWVYSYGHKKWACVLWK
jgi:hypothetical protein